MSHDAAQTLLSFLKMLPRSLFSFVLSCHSELREEPCFVRRSEEEAGSSQAQIFLSHRVLSFGFWVLGFGFWLSDVPVGRNIEF